MVGVKVFDRYIFYVSQRLQIDLDMDNFFFINSLGRIFYTKDSLLGLDLANIGFLQMFLNQILDVKIILSLESVDSRLLLIVSKLIKKVAFFDSSRYDPSSWVDSCSL